MMEGHHHVYQPEVKGLVQVHSASSTTGIMTGSVGMGTHMGAHMGTCLPHHHAVDVQRMMEARHPASMMQAQHESTMMDVSQRVLLEGPHHIAPPAETPSPFHYVSTGIKDTSGAKKKKRAKPMKDPRKPKQPQSPFMCFKNKVWKQVKAGNPNTKVPDLCSMIGRMWRDKVEDERQPYKDMANMDQERYRREMMTYERPTEAQLKQAIKNNKDPRAPKKPVCAFIMFAKEERKKLKVQVPNLRMTEVQHKLSLEWQAMDAQAREKYVIMSKLDSKRYAQQKRDYDENKELELAAQAQAAQVSQVSSSPIPTSVLGPTSLSIASLPAVLQQAIPSIPSIQTIRSMQHNVQTMQQSVQSIQQSVQSMQAMHAMQSMQSMATLQPMATMAGMPGPIGVMTGMPASMVGIGNTQGIPSSMVAQMTMTTANTPMVMTSAMS